MKLMIACFAGPAFHEGSGSVCAYGDRLTSRMAHSVAISTRQNRVARVMTVLPSRRSGQRTCHTHVVSASPDGTARLVPQRFYWLCSLFFEPRDRPRVCGRGVRGGTAPGLEFCPRSADGTQRDMNANDSDAQFGHVCAS